VATTKLVFNKIYTAGFVDLLRHHRIKVRYNQDVINFSFVKQSLPFRPSITFCVSTKGGINILGFKHDYEAKYAARLMAYFLRPYLIPTVPLVTDELIHQAREEERMKRAKALKRKRQLKVKTIQEWMTASQNPIMPHT
jgi:hypothetical protein